MFLENGQILNIPAVSHLYQKGRFWTYWPSSVTHWPVIINCRDLKLRTLSDWCLPLTLKVFLENGQIPNIPAVSHLYQKGRFWPYWPSSVTHWPVIINCRDLKLHTLSHWCLPLTLKVFLENGQILNIPAVSLLYSWQ